jgi:hypothetical protein
MFNERAKVEEMRNLHKNAVFLLNDFYHGEDDLESQCTFDILKKYY